MSRFAPYLGIVAALALGVLIGVFSNTVTPPTPSVTLTIPTTIPSASSTPAIKSSVATTSIATTSVPKKSTATKITNTSASVVPVVPAPLSSAAINALLDTSASALRAALVNIICYAPAGSTLHSISASGVFIDSKGIILTNAHVAQYFLLADRGVSCVIRSGSPAVNKYRAALIYLSPIWIHANPNVLTESLANGTGEDDFALLAVTKSITSEPLPSTFPSLPLATIPSTIGDPVVIASYAAQFLEPNQITSGLSPTVVFGSVKDVFTFGSNTIDVLALGGSVAAQEGSSGGGVVDISGQLAGTITTSTVSGATNTRSLNALTASYIRAEYASETGSALDLLLAESPATAVNDFASKIPALEAVITVQLH